MSLSTFAQGRLELLIRFGTAPRKHRKLGIGFPRFREMESQESGR